MCVWVSKNAIGSLHISFSSTLRLRLISLLSSQNWKTLSEVSFVEEPENSERLFIEFILNLLMRNYGVSLLLRAASVCHLLPVHFSSKTAWQGGAAQGKTGIPGIHPSTQRAPAQTNCMASGFPTNDTSLRQPPLWQVLSVITATPLLGG